ALASLLEPFSDFPFLEMSDLAGVIAATLSPIARHAVGGCVPLFAMRAPTPATGKTLLVDIVSILGTGRPAARMTMPKSDTEFRKVVLAIALEGAPAVLLDNVEGA